ncbi:MAG TPA: hypothetical protein VFG91_04570 [Woeseiaceae bacterium]|nr:hypothetical protein [Woeseiaceae bacterium]
MKQTSKVFLGVAIVLVLLVAGGAWFLYRNLDSLVAGIIEREGTHATQTDVEVGKVTIDLQDGTAGITSLAVANPEGFSEQPAIALEDFAIELDPLAVASDPLVIERIRVDGAHLLVEQEGARNNLETILESVQRLATGAAEPQAEGRRLVIERFELTNARATLLAPQLGEQREVRMPEIVLTDIGRATNGATAAAVAKQLLTPIIGMALESAAETGVTDALKKRLGETEKEIAEGLLDRLGEDQEP